jgi:transcriptional regulator with XRE-family HTH domain
LPSNRLTWARGEVTLATSPTVQRWELAARLRELRREAGLTIEQVAQELMCSPAKVSRMETGLRSVQLRDVRDLAAMYRLSPPEQDRLATLARGARQKAWYDRFELRDQVREYFGLEDGASDVRWADVLLVPGLLQHQAYASELLKEVASIEGLEDLRIDEHVEIRALRQRRLVAAEASYRFIVADAALRVRIGEPRVMAEQMEHLVHVSSLPRVSVRVLSSDRGLGPAIFGTFILMSFDAGLPDVLHREVAEVTVATTDPIVVRRYSDAFAGLEDRAESEGDSLAIFKDMREHWLAST